MRRLVWCVVGILAVFVTALATMTGCGGADCGDGTVERGGECVSELECGTNTHPHDGECVVDEPVDCGDGAERAADTNECIVTDEACGDNTAFSATLGECVSTQDVCGDGTSFDEDTGLCYPDATCRPGDVVVDGHCASDTEALAADADLEADGNTDPEFDGEPPQVGRLDVGEQTVFTGTIDGPGDLDGDGELNQHLDVFQFAADPGDWFEISLYSLGLPDPVFSVGPRGDEDWLRHSPFGTDAGPTRQYVSSPLLLQEITVFPLATVFDPVTAVGDDGWDYVGIIERIEPPEAIEHDVGENLDGTLGELEDNYVVISEFDDDPVSFHWEETPEQAEPAVHVWASPTELIGHFDGIGATFDVPDPEEAFFVFDWNTRDADHGLDYEIAFDRPTTLEPGDYVEQRIEVDSDDQVVVVTPEFETESSGSRIRIERHSGFGGGFAKQQSSQSYIRDGLSEGTHTLQYINDTDEVFENFSYSVEFAYQTQTEVTVDEEHEGKILEVGHDYDTPHELTVVDEDGEEIVSGLVGRDDPGLSVIGVEPGTYTVEHLDFENGEANIETEFVVPTEVTDITEVFDGTIEEHIAGEHDYFRVEFDDTAAYRMVLDQLGGGASPRVSVYEYGHREIRRSADSAPSMELSFEFWSDTPYILRVGNSRRFSVEEADYELRFEEITVERRQFSVSEDQQGDVVAVSHTVGGERVTSATDEATGRKFDLGEITSDDHGLALVGLKSGDYTARVYPDDETEDIDISIGFTTPTEITDFDDAYSGSSDQYFAAEHDYYLIELDETTKYEMTVERTAGDGRPRFSVYRPEHQLREESSLLNGPDEALEFEFEAGIPYILRIGGWHTFSEGPFDYELTFEQQ